MGLSLYDAPQVPPHFWTSDTTDLTLTPSEALPAGAVKSWVEGLADAPMQTGPREAGVSLILAVCACVARATQTAEGVHAIHTGPSIEAGTGKQDKKVKPHHRKDHPDPSRTKCFPISDPCYPQQAIVL